jgi:hypothetical protein
MLAGCGGSSQSTVTGKVSYKGQPLKGGTVTIIPQSGGIASTTIGEDGSYKIDKVPTGPAKVTVDTKSLRPASKNQSFGPYAKAPKDITTPGNQQGDPSRYVQIPDQYADPDSSDLTLTVKKGAQQFDIDLK